MVRQTVMIASLAGIAVAVALTMVPPVAAQTGITCSLGTLPLVRAVGSPTAPMQVPAQVHATICSQNGSIVAVIPSFRTLGPSGAPMIVPVNTNIKTCVPASVVTTPTVGSGLAPAALVQVSPGVFAIDTASTVSPGTPVVVTSVPVTLACF